MKDKALAIGISSLEFTNILCTYYPRGIKETFDIYLFVDDSKIDLIKLKGIFDEHDLDIFKNAQIVILKDLYNHYIQKLGQKYPFKKIPAHSLADHSHADIAITAVIAYVCMAMSAWLCQKDLLIYELAYHTRFIRSHWLTD